MLFSPFLVFAQPAKTVYSKAVPSVWTTGSHWSYTSGGGACSCTPDESKDNIYIETNTSSASGLTFGSSVTLRIRNNSTFTINGNTVFSNGAVIILESGSTLVINGNLDNQNNSDEITINGTLTVNGNFNGGNGSTIVGSGSMTTTGTITTGGSGTVFGSPDPCPVGPCGASLSGGVGPLPVEFLSLTAGYDGYQVSIEWVTGAEFNSDYFMIQRSKDAVMFENVHQVKAAGNSSSVRTYASIDYEPYAGTSYYRLKQVDFDGKTMFSGMVTVTTDAHPILSVFPNPSSGSFSLTMEGGNANEMLVVIRDLQGKEYYSKVVFAAKGREMLAVDVSGTLAPGVYLVVASADQAIAQKKLVIQ